MQAGVLGALYERWIRPDLLVGTSAGAINAAFIASRPPGVETAHELQRIWCGLRRSQVFPRKPVDGGTWVSRLARSLRLGSKAQTHRASVAGMVRMRIAATRNSPRGVPSSGGMEIATRDGPRIVAGGDDRRVRERLCNPRTMTAAIAKGEASPEIPGANEAAAEPAVVSLMASMSVSLLLYFRTSARPVRAFCFARQRR